jgi:hypothetical protein
MGEISNPEAPAGAAPLVASDDRKATTKTSTIELDEALVVLSLLLLGLAVRLLRLQPIEYYEDEVSRWHFVRQWFHGNDFHHATWTHHMARLGVNVPLFFVQALFGRAARVYYVWPVASFLLQQLLVYVTAKRLGGRGAGVLAAIFLAAFSGLDRGASQLLPDAFGGTATILLCYLVARYQEAEPALRRRFLIGAGLAFVWAYEIKESNLLFLPGAVVGVFLCHRRWQDALLFIGVLVGAILIETAGFRLFTDYSSRFAIVGETHGDIGATNFWGLFDRFRRLEPAWQMLLWMWVPSALWLVGSGDRRVFSLVLTPSSFIFLLTFLVRSIDPLVIWTRFYSRYFDPVAPLLVVAVALFLVQAVARAWSNLAPERARGWAAVLSRRAAPLVVVACALVAMTEYAAAAVPSDQHALRETRRISTICNDAYKRNLPIVMRRAPRGEELERRVRPLKLVYGVYLNDAQIATSDLAKDGQLPPTLKALRDSKRYSYVVHDARVYRDGDIEAWVERGCAVVLTEQKGHLNAAPGVPSLILERTDKLPDSCEPPRP